MMKKKYKIGLFIGRFQPLHLGHWYSLKKTLMLADKVVIGIGSANEHGTTNNPWSFGKRKKMVEKALRQLHPQERKRVSGVVGLKDFPEDGPWADEVKNQVEAVAGKIKNWQEVVVVGNNPWTNRVLVEAGLVAYESGLYQRNKLEGKKIRKLIASNDEQWRKLVIGF